MQELELLLKLTEEHGPEAIASVVGVWIAQSHRDRLALYRLRPESPARAPHYLAFVRQQNCCRCGADPRSDPDHIGPRGMGQKTDDYRTVPLCRRCHDLRHQGKLDDFDWQHQMINVLVRYLRFVEQT